MKIKRYGNIYEKIYDIDNLRLAHRSARKGKANYEEVKMVNEDEDYYLEKLQQDLINECYKTSKYDIFTKNDTGKEREIYKLPYYPDRICQWAIMLQIEDIIMNTFTNFSCASIPGKGIHHAFNLLDDYLTEDVNGTKYCLKMDIKKFFPNINHSILKGLLRRKFKDPKLLALLDEIIDSIEGETGIPIGNYTSQYFANFYLTYFDHWLKEEKKLKYVIRYMDDIVILHHDKQFLHSLKLEMEDYLNNNLELEVKGDYQVFPSRVRGIDFVGYRHFGDYVLLRKSTALRLKRKMRGILKKVSNGGDLTNSEWCSINSYKGWVMWCNGYNLTKKYIEPLMPYSDKYYKEVILNESK